MKMIVGFRILNSAAEICFYLLIHQLHFLFSHSVAERDSSHVILSHYLFMF
jgi:hypothetical protein